MVQLARLVYPNNENEEAIDLLKSVVCDCKLLYNFAPAAPNEIVLMTYHKSKGLEFEVVFNMDVYECVMPPFKKPEQSNEVYESEYIQSLNLHYVGITRAKKVCYIMQGTQRHNAKGQIKACIRSKFLSLNGVDTMRKNVKWEKL